MERNTVEKHPDDVGIRMTDLLTRLQKSWTSLTRPQADVLPVASERASLPIPRQDLGLSLDPGDPLITYLLNSPGTVEVAALKIDSPALRRLKELGVKLVLPLVSQGELIGVLNLGPRRSEQDYSTEDRRLLASLAAQAAPALRIAQMVREQQWQARQRERLEHELRVASIIQLTLLPKQVPILPGWRMAVHWQPARAVSGDFYDFIPFPDGKLGIVVGDVTDKGMPAALVMATTRSVLRSAAESLVAPGAVLFQANEKLCPDIPENMFITCLYLLLDPQNGHIWYANAGHNVPYLRRNGRVEELRARGMPLGLIPGSQYEEMQADLAPGDHVTLFSDGLVEAHNPSGEMFGFPRLRQLIAQPECGEKLIQCMLDELHAFSGQDWEQEDDVTLVTLERSRDHTTEHHQLGSTKAMRVLAEFTLPSQPGNERQAMELVARSIQVVPFSADRLERLKTAVAEATMNAMEHGNRYQEDLPVEIAVLIDEDELLVRIRDHGGGKIIPKSQTPDIDAKLKGEQSPRGWGLFLINKMVDEMRARTDETHHTIELVMRLKEPEHD